MKIEKSDIDINEWIDIFKKEINDKLNIDLFNKPNNMSNRTSKSFSDDLLIHIKLVNDSFKSVFSIWEYEVSTLYDSIILYNDVICIEIRENDNILCVVSYNKDISPVLSAEISITLKDIFDVYFSINPEMFIVNPLNNSYIWGEKNINEYKKNSPLRKIKPITYFMDEGNC